MLMGSCRITAVVQVIIAGDCSSEFLWSIWTTYLENHYKTSYRSCRMIMINMFIWQNITTLEQSVLALI